MIMNKKDHLKLTREELHILVWAKPMSEVGQDFQISDRAMAKIPPMIPCIEITVPLSYMGAL